jgi:predicted lipid-binding transport protein (Tim44 family)
MLVVLGGLLIGFLWLGHYIGATKGRGGLGVLLAFLLGPIGLLIVAVMPPTDEKRRQDAARLD